MKIVRFAIDNKVRYGILKGESIQAIEDKPYRYLKPSDCYYQLSEVKLLPPCTPSKIVALGLNYHSHAKEVNARIPNAPLILVWKVSVEDALDYVLGYTCFNDVTARDLQYHDEQWTRAKSFNTFAAVGPCIETELDPGNVVVETYLSGELKQQGNTSDLIYSVPELIDFISHVMTLLPGDIIATGTPSGIGPMYPGDTVEIKIEPIGTLRNYVVKNG